MFPFRIAALFALFFGFSEFAAAQRLTVSYESVYRTPYYKRAGDTAISFIIPEDSHLQLYIDGNRSSFNLPAAKSNGHAGEKGNNFKKNAAGFSVHQVKTPKTTGYYRKNNVGYESVDPITERALMVEDSVSIFNWQFTRTTIPVCGFDCRMAYADLDHGQRVYAFYAWDLPAGFGPFNYTGLPGTVLRVESGSRTYSAVSVKEDGPEVVIPSASVISRDSYTVLAREKRMYRGGLLGKRLDPLTHPPTFGTLVGRVFVP